MERACKTLYKVLTNPSGTELCGRVLVLTEGRLKALTGSPEASRLSFKAYKLSSASR